MWLKYYWKGRKTAKSPIYSSLLVTRHGTYSIREILSSKRIYRKNSKNWDTWNNYHGCPTIGTVGFYSAVLCSKDANRITNREDPDQTAPWGAVWSGSALFAQTYLSQYLKLLRVDMQSHLDRAWQQVIDFWRHWILMTSVKAPIRYH